jgi:hypothetical protein
MALDAKNPPDYDAPVKDLYALGEMPPLGHVPAQMYAWAIRRERHGAPDTAMQVEVVETPSIDSNEVLVLVMAAGVNYNGVWAALGQPISPFDGHGAPYHIAGSDAGKSGMRSSSTATRTTAMMRSATAAIRCFRRRSASGAMRRRTAVLRSSQECRRSN